MMNHILSNTSSWHYRLIVYVFTSEFFLEADGIDIKAMDAVNMEKDFKIIYKKKPKTVNLCPYCRAVVGVVIMFPFIILWRLLPHKKKIYTHQEIMKRSQKHSKIVRIAVAGVMGAFVVWHMSTGNYFFAGFYVGLVIFNLFSTQILTWVVKKIPKRKFKIQSKESKQPSKIVKIISEKHDLICPPIFFVDKTDKKTLR